MNYSKTNAIPKFILNKPIEKYTKADKQKYNGLNAILTFCKTEKRLNQICEAVEEYSHTYIKKIMPMMVSKGYINCVTVETNSYNYNLYTSNIDHLTLDQCQDAISGMLNNICEKLKRTRIKSDAPKGRPKTASDDVIIEGNKTTYSAEYLDKKRKESIAELKEMGLYKQPKARYEINLQGSNSII
jgi:hypothetical protein